MLIYILFLKIICKQHIFILKYFIFKSINKNKFLVDLGLYIGVPVAIVAAIVVALVAFFIYRYSIYHLFLCCISYCLTLKNMCRQATHLTVIVIYSLIRDTPGSLRNPFLMGIMNN